ncbi:MAG: sterol desaturase family protein [Proteobacteria bacterium]|nr:sterol desaturase family protein [Pseudomonadota bacterium]
MTTAELALESPTRRAGEDVFAWTVFPVAMFGSIGLAIAMLNAGANPLLAFALPLLLGYAIVIAGERLYPHVADWSRNHGDVRTDAAWAASIIATGQLMGPAVGLAAIALGGWLSSRLGSPLWPGDWHLAAQLALALVVVEFFQYWVHRLQHETDIMWRFHATHHSAPRLYWLNAARFHVVDIAINNLAVTIPLIALGAGANVIALWILAVTIHGICQHANMKIRCGPLNWIFSMAELHRWHHTRRESNANYGQTLILWDILFGTRFLPSDRKPPADIGIDNLDAFPMTWWAQMLSPFRWSRIVAESAGH